SSPKQVHEATPGHSASSIKRYLHEANKMGLIGKGLNGTRRSEYSLTRFGMLLIRPLCDGFRIEQRHWSHRTQPPTPGTLQAGMAVIARLLRLDPGEDRD